jgi:hypothetical protein
MTMALVIQPAAFVEHSIIGIIILLAFPFSFTISPVTLVAISSFTVIDHFAQLTKSVVFPIFKSSFIKVRLSIRGDTPKCIKTLPMGLLVITLPIVNIAIFVFFIVQI